MSYDVHYDPKDEAEWDRAVENARTYLGSGWERYVIVITSAVVAKHTMEQVHFISSFAGVQGFPVRAVVRYVCKILGIEGVDEDGWPDRREEEEEEEKK